MHEPSFFQGQAILTPKNATLEEINEYVMSLIPAEVVILIFQATQWLTSQMMYTPLNF